MILFRKVLFIVLIIFIFAGCSAKEEKKNYTLSFKANGKQYNFITYSQEVENYYREIRGTWHSDGGGGTFYSVLLSIPFSATNHQVFHQNITDSYGYVKEYYVFIGSFEPGATFTLTLDDYRFDTNTREGDISGSFSGDIYDYNNVSNVITISEGKFSESY